MSTYRRILVAIAAPHEHPAALQRGAELARRADADLQVCLFVYDPLIDATADQVHPEVHRLARAQYLAEQSAALEREVAELADSGLRAEFDVMWSPRLHEAILARILARTPDLVVKDIQRAESALDRLLYTPEDWKLMRLSPAPLMLVRPRSPALPARIAAAVDVQAGTGAGSLNDRIVEESLKLGIFADAQVRVAYVFPYHAENSQAFRKLKGSLADLREAQARRFAEFCDRRQVPEDRRQFLKGGPVRSMAHWLEQSRTDLVVLGTYYRGALDRFFMGSTSEGILGWFVSDVLLVKPPEFVEALARHVDIPALIARHGLEPPRGKRAAA